MTETDKNWLKTRTTMVILRRAYKDMVKERTRGKALPRDLPCAAIVETASKLQSPKLAELYIRSQFHAMPADFCKANFKRPYPPVNVCFGGQSWERYQKYLERGIDDAS